VAWQQFVFQHSMSPLGCCVLRHGHACGYCCYVLASQIQHQPCVLAFLCSTAGWLVAWCAEYLGGAVTCDAHHMTDPRADGLGVSTCIDLAIKDAGVEREQVNYINAHATR